MTHDQLTAMLTSVPAAPDDEGWWEPAAERLLTLYASHGGVALTVSKVDAVKAVDDLVHARTKKGELYMLPLASLFAVAVEGAKTSERKAGFAAER